LNHLVLASPRPPMTSPTKPDIPRGEVHSFKAQDLDKFNSLKLTLTDDLGNSISFIQIKNDKEGYEIFLSIDDYQKIVESGVHLGNVDLHIINSAEFLDLSKRVDIVTRGIFQFNAYVGGETGRCVAGTVGGAISGGLAGGAIGGPAGAIAGTIGGVLVGSASTCK
jgi:hypothetical protein